MSCIIEEPPLQADTPVGKVYIDVTFGILGGAGPCNPSHHRHQPPHHIQIRIKHPRGSGPRCANTRIRRVHSRA